MPRMLRMPRMLPPDARTTDDDYVISAFSAGEVVTLPL